MSAYDDGFYEYMTSEAGSSAAVIVPLVMSMVGPSSVVDVGCGTGSWLAAFASQGVSDYTGVDGEWVRDQRLNVPADRIEFADLAKPFRLPRRYDLVVSLEVAEHLPAECAAAFVETLVSLGRVVLFSAAIPGQGGVNHLNEQWPAFWAALFSKMGFVAVDCIRPQVWHDERVAYYYAQNMLFFVASEHLPAYPGLLPNARFKHDVPPALIHPKYVAQLLDKQKSEWTSVRRLLAAIPGAIVNAIGRRLT